jgi:hemerythrin superfamily protein
VSAQQDLRKAQQRPDDLVAAILQDHTEIKQMFAAVDSASDTAARDERFRMLMRNLIIHATAEQEVSHPLARKATGGDRVVDQRLQEEKKGEEVLKRLEALNAGDPDFKLTFKSMRQDVLDHAEHEEREELPLLVQAGDRQLKKMGTVFRAAEKATPTHPHPTSPTSATRNLVVGPFMAIVDRARDAIAAARKENGE